MSEISINLTQEKIKISVSIMLKCGKNELRDRSLFKCQGGGGG